MGLAHGDILSKMIPTSHKFLISCFKNLWCLRAKGYGWAATGATSHLVAMCILMRSVWPMSMSLFEMMVSHFCNSLYKVDFVSFEMFASFNSTCLCIWTLLDINTEIFGIGCKLLWILHKGDEWLSSFIPCASIWLELISCVTSFTAGGFKESSTSLNGFISFQYASFLAGYHHQGLCL